MVKYGSKCVGVISVFREERTINHVSNSYHQEHKGVEDHSEDVVDMFGDEAEAEDDKGGGGEV